MQSNEQRVVSVSRWRATVWVFPLAVLAGGLTAQEGAGEKLDASRTALEKYVETRGIISEEKRNQVLGRQLLTDQIEVTKSRIEALRAKITETQGNITDAEAKRSELAEQDRKLKAATADLASTIATLEARTKALLPRLPEPVRDKVRLVSQRIPEDPDKTELTLGERFLNVTGVLTEVNKSNREITIATEVLTLADGSRPQVTVLYLGIGLAYYVNAKKTVAGIGAAGADAWTWTPADDLAGRVAEAIAILKNEKSAAFVGLPVNIQ